MNQQKRKKKKCPECKELYLPVRSFQPCCNEFKCQKAYLAKDRDKKVAKGLKMAQKEQRKDTRERKRKLMTKKQWIPKAEYQARKYARVRDKDEPCISCGKHDHEIEDVFVGGKWDGGHFRSKGAETALRFHPDNIHKQCKSCNGGSGKFARKNETVQQKYEANLRKKIGDKIVDYLKTDQMTQNWTIEDLQDIEQYYKEQTKLLEEI